jgi:anthranilate synthase component 2
MVVLIDNYDSFSYNLVQMAGSICPHIKVVRNDEMTVEEIEELKPSHLILSPGPGYPRQAGICEEAVKKLQGKVPILGVCLGHQGICEAYGAAIGHAKELMHGKQSRITIDTESYLFRGLQKEIDVARYHSLVAVKETMPDCLRIIGTAKNGVIIAVQHQNYLVYGVQFHPESILTPQGHKIMENFLSL